MFGSYLCPSCFSQLSFDTKVICLECGRGSIDGRTHPLCKKQASISGVFCGVTYNFVAKKLVYNLKYKPYISQVEKEIVELCYESLIQKEVFMKIVSSTCVLVPIPLAARKFRQRGYNQSLLLAYGLAKKFSLPVADVLRRKKETKPQFGLQKDERKKNIKDAFILKGAIPSDVATVLLIDDVLTTGATLMEASKLLKQCGVREVWGITFARD